MSVYIKIGIAIAVLSIISVSYRITYNSGYDVGYKERSVEIIEATKSVNKSLDIAGDDGSKDAFDYQRKSNELDDILRGVEDEANKDSGNNCAIGVDGVRRLNSITGE